MRSRLEARTAYLLDQLNIDWEYEKHKIQLSNGETYIPDFYLPNREKWIECKGDLEDPSMKKPWQLAKDKQQDVLIISQKQAIYWTLFQKGETGKSNTIHLVKCSDCGEHSFVPNIGSWHCRNCQTHKGDHDIVYYDVFGDSWKGTPSLEIKSTEKIKDFLSKVKE